MHHPADPTAALFLYARAAEGGSAVGSTNLAYLLGTRHIRLNHDLHDHDLHDHDDDDDDDDDHDQGWGEQTGRTRERSDWGGRVGHPQKGTPGAVGAVGAVGAGVDGERDEIDLLYDADIRVEEEKKKKKKKIDLDLDLDLGVDQDQNRKEEEEEEEEEEEAKEEAKYPPLEKKAKANQEEEERREKELVATLARTVRVALMATRQQPNTWVAGTGFNMAGNAYYALAASIRHQCEGTQP